MIKTKSVYDSIDLKSDGFRVLVMRKWPRGIGYKKHAIHKWIKEVGPSRELLHRWNSSEITWEDYVKQYCAVSNSNHHHSRDTTYWQYSRWSCSRGIKEKNKHTVRTLLGFSTFQVQG